MKRVQRKISQARKTSHDLFLQAKRRFQYKPLGKRQEQRPPDRIHSPECSSVTENNKEHSNDFSWLDKMVSGFDCSSKESENRGGMVAAAGDRREERQEQQQQQQQQHKPAYFEKRRQVLAERPLSNKINSNSHSNSHHSSNHHQKPIIKKSLQRSKQKNRGTIHRAAITKRQYQPQPKQLQVQIAPQPQLFPLFPKQQDNQSSPKQQLSSIMHNLNLRTQPIAIDMQVTVLKIQQPRTNPRNPPPPPPRQSVIYPTPQKSPQKRITQSAMGKIKKNGGRIVQQKKAMPEETKKVVQETKKVVAHNCLNLAAIQKYGVLGYCQETIQEEEDERSCETNRLEEKFREIFSELDGNRAGYIDRQNYCTENINDQIRYLIGPILSKIKYQQKRFTLHNFIDQGKRIISALQSHEVSKLLRCSVTNRLFCLDTKRSQNDRLTYRDRQDRKSCSTLQRSYARCRDEGRAEEEGKLELLQHVSRSASEDWRSGGGEMLEKTRARSIGREREQYPVREQQQQVVAREQPAITRDLYLMRRSGGRSIERIVSQHNISRNSFSHHPQPSSQATITQWQTQNPQRPPNPCRQAYLSRMSRSPKLQTSQLDRSLQLQPFPSRPTQTQLPSTQLPSTAVDLTDQKYLLERQQCNRIDSLNERLSKYIHENQLRITRNGSISLEFAELRKHLRE